MNDDYTEAIREAMAIAPASQVILETLEITQGEVQLPIYLVKSQRDFPAFDENARSLVFRAAGFNISLPASNEEGFRSLDIAIDNIGRQVSDFITQAQLYRQTVEVRYRPYLSNDPSRPQMSAPLLLYLKTTQETPLQVVGRATFMDLTNARFPSELYTRELFPAL